MRIIRFEKLRQEVHGDNGGFMLADGGTGQYERWDVKIKSNVCTHQAFIQTDNWYGCVFGTENLRNELIERGFIDDTKLISRTQKDGNNSSKP